jgi:hypothetical protein
VVLSHGTSSCSCVLVALPPPSDAVPACRCVSTPVMRAAVCLLYASALNIVVSLFCMCVICSIHALFAVAVLLLLRAERLFARAWRRCRCVLTYGSVAVSLRCRVG